MITFVVTTSLILHPTLLETIDRNIIPHISNMRYIHYIKSLQHILEFSKEINARVIIVENNGTRETIFDTMGCDVLYTTNNFLPTKNKGTKELLDVWNCIQHFHIPDDELIVKITGRYTLDLSGNFCNALRNYDTNKTDCIIRYGWFGDMSNEEPHENCLTGLIAMKCKYIKEIKHNDIPTECVEINWAKKSLLLEKERVKVIRGSIGFRMYEWNTFDYKDL